MPPLISLSEQDRDEVLRLADEKDLMGAVSHVRRVIGAPLADAVFTLRHVLREAGRQTLGAALSGEIRFVGPYRHDLGEHLPHAGKVEEGDLVMGMLFAADVYRDELKMHELAACFHARLWDFNTHELDPWRADLQALQAFDELGYGAELVDQFVALRAAGFKFYLRIRPSYERERRFSCYTHLR